MAIRRRGVRCAVLCCVAVSFILLPVLAVRPVSGNVPWVEPGGLRGMQDEISSIVRLQSVLDMQVGLERACGGDYSALPSSEIGGVELRPLDEGRSYSLKLLGESDAFCRLVAGVMRPGSWEGLRINGIPSRPGSEAARACRADHWLWGATNVIESVGGVRPVSKFF